MFHRANHAKNTLTIRNKRTSHTHKPNCFGQKNYWHTKRIRIWVLFRIRIQNKNPQINCHFFFPSISATTLPQINCYYFYSSPFSNSIAINQLPQYFFPSSFGLNVLFFPSFSATSLPKLLLNFFPSFRQLGWHNSLFFLFFFLHIFSNLVVTILIFSLLTPLQFQQLGCHNWFPFWALHLALRALHLAGRVLGSKNFSNEITVI